jgi:hypothetical protein
MQPLDMSRFIFFLFKNNLVFSLLKNNKMTDLILIVGYQVRSGSFM